MRVIFNNNLMLFLYVQCHVCHIIIMFSNKVTMGFCCLRVNNLSYRFIDKLIKYYKVSVLSRVNIKKKKTIDEHKN